MKLLIPLAGFGTRLRPHTYSRPKPLLNVAGKPVLAHLIDRFADLPVEEFIFITGWLGEQIKEYVRATYPDKPSHFFVQEEMSGQSPAIYLAKDALEGPLFILFSDTIFEADLRFVTGSDADGIAFVKTVDDPRRFGVAALDEAGFVTEFIEKPATTENKLAVIGLYYIQDSRALVEAIETQLSTGRKTKGEFFLVDALQILIGRGKRFTVSEVDAWLDTGTVGSTLETNRLLLARGHDNSATITAEGIVIVPPVNIHPSASITNAVIGPHATISANCLIDNSIIRNSIIEANTTITNMLLEHSLIGQHTQIAGRFQTLNIGDTASVIDA